MQQGLYESQRDWYRAKTTIIGCIILSVTPPNQDPADSDSGTIARANKVLEENPELHRRLNLTQVMLATTEPDERYTWVNNVMLQYFGLSAADINSGDLRSRVHPDDFQRVRGQRQRALASDVPFEYENRMRRHDGQYRWFLVRYQPLKDAAGRVVRWYGSAIDIEDRKQVEEALRRSEAYLAEAQSLTHTGSWTLQADTGGWVVRYMSEEDFRIWGFDPADGLPTAEMVRQRIHPEDRRALERGETALRAKTDYSDEFRIVLPDGRIRHIRLVGHSRFSASENCMEMVGTHVDVTEHKRAEEERARLRMEHLAREFELSLEVRVAERTRIARELHDTLLQSFNGLLLRLRTVRVLLSQSPDQARSNLEDAIDETRQALTEGRKAVQGLRPSAVETHKQFSEAIKTLMEELASDPSHRGGAEVSLAIEGTPRRKRPFIRDEIYRIASEALRNAFRHAEASHIEVQLSYGEKSFELRVRDDGKGIDQKFLTDEGRAGHFGLRGMRERAQQIGGQLTVWSAPGSGTELVLSVPAVLAYAASSAP